MLSISRQQHGVSLVESMIALLVISIGLLGIAALQVTSISQNSSAFHHSQAVWAAYDMSDRIQYLAGQKLKKQGWAKAEKTRLGKS